MRPFLDDHMSEQEENAGDPTTEENAPQTEASGKPAEPESTEHNGEVQTEPQEEVDPITALQAEAEHWKDQALRQKADLENFRKRTTRERQDAIRYANGSLLEALLPILDNFDMGLDAARAESESSMIFQGMSMVSNQLKGFLEDLGVTEVEAEGVEFDPNSHEAVSQEASDSVPEGMIVRVMRRGYRLRDRLLRAPTVVVSTGPGAESGGAAGGGDGGLTRR